MTWIKLHDNVIRHPKIAPLTHAGFRWWIRGLCYASEFLTDGVLPDVFVSEVPRAIYDELQRNGLWERDVSGTTRIHDYLDHQTSRATVDRERRRSFDRRTGGRPPVHDSDPPAVNRRSTAGKPRPEYRDQNTEVLLPPLPARRAGTGDTCVGILDELEGVLRTLTIGECATASSFQDAFEAKCRALGWRVQREVRVENRGDGRAGYVDLVVHEPFALALELDRQTPRVKSIEKLASLATLGYTPVVVCRNAGAPGWSTTRGVHVWGKPKANKPTLTRFASLGVRE